MLNYIYSYGFLAYFTRPFVSVLLRRGGGGGGGVMEYFWATRNQPDFKRNWSGITGKYEYSSPPPPPPPPINALATALAIHALFITR